MRLYTAKIACSVRVASENTSLGSSAEGLLDSKKSHEANVSAERQMIAIYFAFIFLIINRLD